MTSEVERLATHRAVAAARSIRSLWHGEGIREIAAPWNEILPETVKGRGDVSEVTIIRGLRCVVAGAWIKSYAGDLFCMYSGVSNYTARNLCYGWASQASMLRAGGFNNNAADDADTGQAPQRFASLVQCRAIYIYGHSGGGVIAEALAAQLDKNIGIPIRELITFGTPKPGLAGVTFNSVAATRIRWMNTNDPIPGLPFGRAGETIPIAIDLFSPDYQPDLIRHGPGGRTLQPDGSWNDADDSVRPFDPDRVGLALWLYGQDASRGRPHSIDTYIARLTRLATRLDDNREPETIAPPTIRYAMEFVLPPRRPPNNLVPEFIGTFTISGNTATPSVGEQFPVSTQRNSDMAAQTKIAPSLRLVMQRTGNVYVVRWNDVILFSCPYGSNARSIVRSWNRSIRLLGKTTDISQNNFSAYFSNLFAAGALGNGVTPPWHVS